MTYIKELYRDDLKNRYPGHTFSEKTKLDDPKFGDMTLVEFKDGSSVVIRSAKKLDVDDAYRIIREDLVGGHEILITITETQRDLITSPATGTHIFNTDATVEVYDGTNWIPV